MRFKDRVAVITGAAAGMARAVALGLAREGAAVVINDQDEAGLNQVAAEITKAGGDAATVPGDITAGENIAALVATALERHGRIDILFNYVGGGPDLAPMAPFVEQPEALWDRIIVLNIKSTLVLTRAILPGMMERKYGKIVNTAAMAGRIGSANMAVYATVKGGIIAFTKSLALEVAPYNINVNCISPGPIATPGLEKVFQAEGREHVADIVPLGRVGLPEEAAAAVLYLASDEAAFITGQTLAVDGGATRV